MAGITKRERVDRILAANAKDVAALGIDSTPEEKIDVNRKWAERLAKIFTIDPVRATGLKGSEEIDIEGIVGRMIEEYAAIEDKITSDANELSERIWSIFSQSHQLFPFEFVLESLVKLELDVAVFSGGGKYSISTKGMVGAGGDNFTSLTHVLDNEDWFDTPRKALTHFFNS